jgi:hypothetical protein
MLAGLLTLLRYADSCDAGRDWPDCIASVAAEALEKLAQAEPATEKDSDLSSQRRRPPAPQRSLCADTVRTRTARRPPGLAEGLRRSAMLAALLLRRAEYLLDHPAAGHRLRAVGAVPCKASAARRRSASARDGVSDCAARHASIAPIIGLCRRTTTCSPGPVVRFPASGSSWKGLARDSVVMDNPDCRQWVTLRSAVNRVQSSRRPRSRRDSSVQVMAQVSDVIDGDDHSVHQRP